MTSPSYPPSIELARLPTPLVPLERLSERLGVEILCKRDDLTGSELSGNKVRKLEFLLADALECGSTGVVTCGGEQSNHARSTAIAAARLGLGCKLLLRTADPARPPASTGNILLERMAGAEIEWISPEQYAERDALMAARRGADGYVIDEGGSNEIGSWGYVRCVQELAAELGDRSATIVHAIGSGGTSAGLLAGCRLFDLPYRPIGVCVADDRDGLRQRVVGILHGMSERFGVDVTVEPEGVELWDGYFGRGYGLSNEQELRCMIDVARSEALITDPVYSGKALFGLLSELERGVRLAEPVVFLHTGGIFGLFDRAQTIADLCG